MLVKLSVFMFRWVLLLLCYMVSWLLNCESVNGWVKVCGKCSMVVCVGSFSVMVVVLLCSVLLSWLMFGRWLIGLMFIFWSCVCRCSSLGLCCYCRLVLVILLCGLFVFSYCVSVGDRFGLSVSYGISGVSCRWLVVMLICNVLVEGWCSVVISVLLLLLV